MQGPERNCECPFLEVLENSMHVLILRTMSAYSILSLYVYFVVLMCVLEEGEKDVIVHLQLTRYYFKILNTYISVIGSRD